MFNVSCIHPPKNATRVKSSIELVMKSLESFHDFSYIGAGQALRFLYAGHFPHPYVFGLKQLPPTGDVLYFTGGEKDVLSLSSHGFHAISLNSETARVPEGLVSSLLKRFNDFAILYDVDETGLKEAENRVKEIQELGFSNVWQIRLPLAGTKQEKDISDFFRLGHTSEELQGITEMAMLNKERSLCR